MEKFHLSRLPALPEVLLQCSETSRVPSTQQDELSGTAVKLSQVVACDPALMLKVLSARASLPSLADIDPDSLVSGLGESNFTLLWSQTVLNDWLLSHEGQPLRFLHAHWAQSVRAAHLMQKLAGELGYEYPRAAGVCGLLLSGGQLVLATIDPEKYLPIACDSESPQQCLEQEQDAFGVQSHELMSQLLERMQVPTLLCDAVRYQYEDAEAVESSPLLVRMAWLVRQLSGNRRLLPETEASAQELLGLSRSDLAVVMDDADRELQELIDSWDIAKVDPVFPPIKGANTDVLKSRHQTAREKVQVRANAIALSSMLESAVNADAATGGGTGDNSYIQQLASRGLRLFLESPAWLLLRHDREKQALVPVGSTLNTDLTRAMQFSCKAGNGGRSIATRSFQQEEPLSLGVDDLTAVIDKQILKSFRCDRLQTIPLMHRGLASGLLVLGRRENEGSGQEEGLQSELMKRFIARLGAGLMTPGARHTAPVMQTEDMVEEQQIKALIHEVNNPLSVIKNYLQLLSMKQGDESDAREEIDVINSEIDRVSTILREFRAQESEKQTQHVSLNPVVEKLAMMFGGSLSKEDAITIETELEEGLPPLFSNEDKVRQILTNLVKNAIEAMPEGGSIRIGTGSIIDMDGKRYQELTVSDSGPGIDPDVLAGLFRFGKSTKDDSHSGAGLAIVRNLTAELGGRVNCQSGGKGTSFSLLLPASETTETD